MKTALHTIGKIFLFIAWCIELIGIFLTLIILREIHGVFWEGMFSLIILSAMFIFTSFKLGKVSKIESPAKPFIMAKH